MKLVLFVVLTFILNSQNIIGDPNNESKKQIEYHVFGGLPLDTNLLIRNTYVNSYNKTTRQPNWVAYQMRYSNISLKIPKREKRFLYYRTDTSLVNPVKKKEYDHSGYERGHIAPWFSSRGDHDNDGQIANLDTSITDPYDDQAIYQINYMSNFSPQTKSLNGSGGIWYKLEAKMHKVITKKEKNVWVIAGPIFLDDNYEFLKNKKTGKISNIPIPDAFFKIVITKDLKTYSFLFPHDAKKYKKSSDYKSLDKYLVTIDSIETLTGFDFLNQLEDDKETVIESSLNILSWLKLSK